MARPTKSQKTRAPEAAKRVTLQVAAPRARAKVPRPINIPTKVLEIICGFLHPLDLLQLLRCTITTTGKVLREDVYWKAAARNVDGLLPCPPYLDERMYANIVFSPHCSRCHRYAPGEQRIFIEFSARYCTSCEKKDIVSGSDPDAVYLVSSALCIPGCTRTPLVAAQRLPQESRHYSRSHLEEFGKQWVALTTHKAKVSFLQGEIQNAEEVEAFATRFYQWTTARPLDEREAIEEMKMRRIEDILVRLETSAWSEEIPVINPTVLRSQLRTRDFSWQPVPLTDENWQGIESAAHLWMAFVACKRLRVHYEVTMLPLLETIKRSFQNWAQESWPAVSEVAAFLPRRSFKLLDWLLSPGVGEVIERGLDPDGDSELPVLVTLRKNFADSVLDWLFFCAQALNRKLSSQPIETRGPEEVHVLHRATSLFDCRHCDEQFMAFPDVLAHRCRLSRPSDDDPILSTVAIFEEYGKRQRLKAAWNPNSICVNPRMYPDKIRALIEALGLTPDNATHEMMLQCTRRLTCNDCGPVAKHKYEVFDWRRALYHQDNKKHAGSAVPCQWNAISWEDEVKVREFEEQTSSGPFSRRVERYICYVEGCDAVFKHYKSADLLLHLQQRHGVLSDAQDLTDEMCKPYYMEEVKRIKASAPHHICFQRTTRGVEVSIDLK